MAQIALSGALSTETSMKRRNRDLSRVSGFTLIEVLIVLAIIGLVMSLVGPRVVGYLSSSKEQAARLQIKSLSTALELFYLDTGRYPSNKEGLRILVERPEALATWNGPYLRNGELPRDPWGQSYSYKTPGAHSPFEISSPGLRADVISDAAREALP